MASTRLARSSSPDRSAVDRVRRAVNTDPIPALSRSSSPSSRFSSLHSRSSRSTRAHFRAGTKSESSRSVSGWAPCARSRKSSSLWGPASAPAPQTKARANSSTSGRRTLSRTIYRSRRAFRKAAAPSRPSRCAKYQLSNSHSAAPLFSARQTRSRTAVTRWRHSRVSRQTGRPPIQPSGRKARAVFSPNCPKCLSSMGRNVVRSMGTPLSVLCSFSP